MNYETKDREPGKTEGGFLGLLRAVALIAVVAGAVGSVGLMLRADQRTPRFLLVIFVFWVLSPFVGLAWANVISKRWPVLTRAALYGVTLLITLGSLACYGKLILPPAGSPRAFVFVAVPPASWLFMAIVVSAAALISRGRSQRSSGA
jgi:hypothetical protein